MPHNGNAIPYFTFAAMSTNKLPILRGLEWLSWQLVVMVMWVSGAQKDRGKYGVMSCFIIAWDYHLCLIYSYSNILLLWYWRCNLYTITFFFNMVFTWFQYLFCKCHTVITVSRLWRRDGADTPMMHSNGVICIFWLCFGVQTILNSLKIKPL